ncbi:zinc-dependent alcohol dehydrogenase family protein [Streptomyces sp. NBC_01465]|uniref:zinc-dependent alcohol dehydrogenase family protein n=1 Tax=Streptomyces sp. NBC_01465 TaxID=2903878 RepID=UPI002E369935|nr:zinc-dependent alcohol dehydrogenase family protein [Streptomyces sp. NBC_01465]
MRAVVFERFGEPAGVRDVPDPVAAPRGVVVRVEATGVCRSDWHGWMGHEPEIVLPHVPGHEFAGVVAEVGAEVRGWRVGDRVTVPFSCGCGSCPTCASGNHQVCERGATPGFTHWGSFAEYIALDHADVNLVALPDDMAFTAAAGLGCRFATAFRAVVQQGRVAAGEWVAVHGCGGVGLSAVMIAAASGARVVAVDVAPGALELARKFGAVECVDATGVSDTAEVVRELTGGGAHLSLDALGAQVTCAASIGSLRRRGRHVQVGLLHDDPVMPMGRAIAYELQLIGSRGMAAHTYPGMLALVRSGVLRPDLLVTSTIGLGEAGAALAAMGSAPGPGVTVVEPFTP